MMVEFIAHVDTLFTVNGSSVSQSTVAKHIDFSPHEPTGGE
jgi:hypothetical protein